MGKKKRGHPDAEEILSRPWCYYCERDFDDLKILISHQKAKHFKCERCGRRLNTAGGLSVHLNQVHKETLTTVENALPNRSNLDVEIFGMEGIPEDVVGAHNQRVLSQFQTAEAERRVATGNPPAGSGAGSGGKKAKFESPGDIKKRLAEHKARMAEQTAGGSSGGATPVGAGQGTASPAVVQSPGTLAAPPAYQQPQQSQNVTPNNSNFPPFQNASNPPGGNYGPGQPPFSQAQQENFQTAYRQYPQQNISQYHGAPHFPPQGGSGSPPYTGGAPAYGAGSPPLPYHQSFQDPYRTQTPPQNAHLPPRPGSLPPANAGLPQRPSFGAAPANTHQTNHFHQGQPRVGHDHQFSQASPPHQQQPGAWGGISNGGYRQTTVPDQAQSAVEMPAEAGNLALNPSTNASSLDDLVSGAARDADKAEAKGRQEAGEKKSKKEKDKPTRLIFSDNDVSPEEKMAKLPRYAFNPKDKEETVLGDATVPTVAGAQVGSDDVLDPSG
ncbi:MAG: hypothetical protein M4579_002977 [Chaenotheca gracillima]|nr:MAG: hypothetical protein M4579_002977 [Chaenotheca gracillima]